MPGGGYLYNKEEKCIMLTVTPLFPKLGSSVYPYVFAKLVITEFERTN